MKFGLRMACSGEIKGGCSFARFGPNQKAITISAQYR
jgi:hypothetical protein